MLSSPFVPTHGLETHWIGKGAANTFATGRNSVDVITTVPITDKKNDNKAELVAELFTFGSNNILLVGFPPNL